MNNRSLAQIIAEYQEPDRKPVASGEVDGMRYDLYDAPSREDPHAGEHERLVEVGGVRDDGPREIKLEARFVIRARNEW